MNRMWSVINRKYSCEEISNNCHLLIAHITLNKLVHISRRWVYINGHSNYNKL